MTRTRPAHALLAAALMWGAGCSLQETAIPGLTGPSGLARSVSVAATPDSIMRDGVAQSTILVTARGADGDPIASLGVRLDMSVDGVRQDLGTLSARTIQTDLNGRGSAVYTAPPPPPPSGDAVTIVTILATPIDSNHQGALTHSAEIRLTTPGVIQPPAETPTARLSFSPESPAINTPVYFDASASCAGAGPCSSTAGLVAFDWTFGDGSQATGERPTKNFAAPGVYTVVLKVTNDRGLSASTTTTVTVGPGTPPTASFVFSPTAPLVGQMVVFNAEAARAAPGRQIVDYGWEWGDDTPGRNGPGVVQTGHAFEVEGTYVVVLTVVDDVGQRSTATQTVTVGSGIPAAVFTVSPEPPVVIGTRIFFDGSMSIAAPGTTIEFYAWSFGDGTQSGTSREPTVEKSYAAANTYVVTLTVTDSLGRTSMASQTVTVESGTPAAAFIVSPQPPVSPGTSLTFDGSSSAAVPGASIVSYTWSFGDGTGSGPNASPIAAKSYSAAGTYIVTLTVTDNMGRTSTVNQAVGVQ
jgi:PKD repeat protein